MSGLVHAVEDALCVNNVPVSRLQYSFGIKEDASDGLECLVCLAGRQQGLSPFQARMYQGGFKFPVGVGCR
ncbi:hypothetical protein [Actinacidiphila glaucinigra]